MKKTCRPHAERHVPSSCIDALKFESESKTQRKKWHSKMEQKLGFSWKCAMEVHFHAFLKFWLNFWLIFHWKLKWKLEWKLAENPNCEHPYCYIKCSKLSLTKMLVLLQSTLYITQSTTSTPLCIYWPLCPIRPVSLMKHHGFKGHQSKWSVDNNTADSRSWRREILSPALGTTDPSRAPFTSLPKLNYT